jgi:hypothetical protein
MAEPNGTLGRLEAATTEILVELQHIREELGIRPTYTETTVKRRLSVISLLLVIFVAIQVHDGHVESCAPGARSEAGIDYVAEAIPGEFDSEEMQRLLSQDVSPLCDVTFPTHSHNGEGWPTGGNILGLVLYALIALLGWVWYRKPIWDDHRAGTAYPVLPPEEPRDNPILTDKDS